MAGYRIMLCTSPNDVARTISFKRSMNAKTSARPASFNSKLIMAPYNPAGNNRAIVAASGCAGSAVKFTLATLGFAANHAATRQAFEHWRSMRNANVLMPRMVRYDSNGPSTGP